MRKHFPLFLLSLIIVVADQISKRWILDHFAIGQMQNVIPNFFDLVHVRNFGAAFGFLANAPESIRQYLFYVITLVAMSMLINLYRKSDSLRIAISIIIGGALGNIIDRIIHGSVVDFLSFHYQRWYWPAFNVADMAITCGVFYLVIRMYQLEKKPKVGDA